MKTYGHTHTHTHIHTHIHIYIYTYTHTHIYTYTHNRNIWPSATPTANQYKHMAQRHIIETYGRAPRPQPTNTNIWPSPTPTANQYKHMAQRRIIETYGHTIAGRRSSVTPGRFFCLCWCSPSTHYSCCLHVYVHVHTESFIMSNQCP